jgi:hypothetical protein
LNPENLATKVTAVSLLIAGGMGGHSQPRQGNDMDTYADDLAELLARLIARSLPGLRWPLAVRINP